MRAWTGIVLVLLAACGGSAPLLGPPPCETAAGDAVWSALQVAPPEGEGEWLRLTNPGEHELNLHRAVVAVAGRGALRRWTLDGVRLAPGESLRLDAERLSGLGLADAGGEAVLSCAGTVVHRLRWGEGGVPVGQGVWVRDAQAPASVDDRPDWWCPDPGGEAPVCGVAFCREGDGVRAVRALRRLVLNEVLADPDGRDEGREWIEVLGDGAGDLNGLILRLVDERGRERRWRLRHAECLPAAGRRRLWLGETAPAPRLAGPGLPNGGGTLALRLGDVVLDEVAVPPAQSGASWSRDENDGAWCAGRATPGGGVAATPEAPNPPCGPTCWEDGRWRARRDPGPGEVAVTEVMADPGGADAGREWLELRSLAAGPVDLGGLSLGVASEGRERGPWPLADAACLPLAPGAARLLAGEAVEAPPEALITRLSALALYNAAQTLTLSAPEAPVDEARLPAPPTGRALGVGDGPGAAARNDDPAAWCAQRLVLADGDRGTPGRANDPCGAVCLDPELDWRPWRVPAPGDLALVALGQGEAGDWVTVQALGADVDANGLWLTQENAQGHRRAWRLAARHCLALAPGARLRIGAGGLAVEPVLDLYLNRTTLTLESGDGVVDRAQVQVRRDRELVVPDPRPDLANDDADAWCEAPCAP